MPICGIVGCQNRPVVNKEFSFFKLPKVVVNQGEEAKQLSEERRRLWKAAVNRKDITSEEKWERTLVCSKHFVGGKKAYLHDSLNPAWLPTLHLGYGSPGSKGERYNRSRQRREKRNADDAAFPPAKKRINLKEDPSDLSGNYTNGTERHPDSPNSNGALTIKTESIGKMSSKESGEIQTDLPSDGIKQLEDDLRARVSDSKQSFNTKHLYTFEYYEQNPNHVQFYTGMPNFGTLKLTFEELVEAYMLNDANSLSKENQYLLCLVKLRMNYLFKDIANHLEVSPATVQRSFHDTLDVLYSRLKFLICWPDQESVRESMPICFQKILGCSVVVMLDSFELFTERPSGALNKVYSYSSYKHHQTVKYLIGVAPQGIVTFISEGWGGRTSEKYITEKCGILDNLLPGDTLNVNRGFNIDESVNSYQANLDTPNFTKGKSQLHTLEVEKTRKIAAVERVIGLLLRKFRIFEGIIPLEFLKLQVGEQIPTIDKIVHVACAIVNLAPSVVQFE